MDVFEIAFLVAVGVPVTWYCFSKIKFFWFRFIYRKRETYITDYTFPTRLRIKLKEHYPHLSNAQCEEAEQGLKDYFYICQLAGKKMVSMPSQAVDVMWHEFILFTRDYQLFCKKSFGRFLHHVPAEAMRSPEFAQIGVKRTWKIACYREGIDPKNPDRLPFIFSLDDRLSIPDGFVYRLNCGGSNSRNEYCASHIGCTASGCGGLGGSCGSSGCFSSGGDSSGCGSGCGGGCGGG